MTDFGLCKEGMEQEETTSTFCGTPEVQRVLGFLCDLGAQSLQRFAVLGLRLVCVLNFSKHSLWIRTFWALSGCQPKAGVQIRFSLLSRDIFTCDSWLVFQTCCATGAGIPVLGNSWCCETGAAAGGCGDNLDPGSLWPGCLPAPIPWSCRTRILLAPTHTGPCWAPLCVLGVWELQNTLCRGEEQAFSLMHLKQVLLQPVSSLASGRIFFPASCWAGDFGSTLVSVTHLSCCPSSGGLKKGL